MTDALPDCGCGDPSLCLEAVPGEACRAGHAQVRTDAIAKLFQRSTAADIARRTRCEDESGGGYRYDCTDETLCELVADEIAGMLTEIWMLVSAEREQHASLEARWREKADNLSRIIEEMRTIAMVAGQCSIEGPENSMALMAAAEAERCGRWADDLAVLRIASHEVHETTKDDALTRSATEESRS